MKLTNKVALVTGGGRGIGRAMALAFAHEGASVIVAARTVSEIEATAMEITNLGRQALAIPTDVSNWEQVKAMVERTVESFGTIDVLVNDARIQGPIGALTDNSVADWVEAININLLGVAFSMRAVLPTMISNRRGKIINLSGGGAAGSRSYFSSYAAAKVGVVRLTECIAEEVMEYNIQVNAMAPGPCNTRMFQEILAAGKAAGDS